MKIQISFDNGTVMRLENVKTFGFDAEDSTYEDMDIIKPPDFISEKVNKLSTTEANLEILND